MPRYKLKVVAPAGRTNLAALFELFNARAESNRFALKLLTQEFWEALGMGEEKFDFCVLWAVRVASAYVTRNPVAATALPALLASVHATLLDLVSGPSSLAPTPQKPAVPIRKSVSDDYLICLEDGRKFKSLKRHLRVRYNLTPEQYRLKWQLPPEYPMVARAYAQTRSEMAKSMGLGQQRRPLKHE